VHIDVEQLEIFRGKLQSYGLGFSRIEQRLSPHTQTDLDELGSQTGTDGTGMPPTYVAPPIPKSYWNLSGAMYAYLYGELAKLGIDVAGESQLLGFPTQWPSVSLVNWDTGQPNARFWMLQLLRTNFGPGDTLITTNTGTPSVYGLGFVTHDGKHKLLLINKRDRTIIASIHGASGGRLGVVDQQAAFQPPAGTQLQSDDMRLGGLAVAVVTLPEVRNNMHRKSLTMLFAKLIQPRHLVVALALVFLILAQQPLLAQVDSKEYGGTRTDFAVPGGSGFVIKPDHPKEAGLNSWLWYAPTFVKATPQMGRYPNKSLTWLFTRLLDKGV
jgi:hypothetical protein